MRIEIVVRCPESYGCVDFENGLAKRIFLGDKPHIHLANPSLRRFECCSENWIFHQFASRAFGLVRGFQPTSLFARKPKGERRHTVCGTRQTVASEALADVSTAANIQVLRTFGKQVNPRIRDQLGQRRVSNRFHFNEASERRLQGIYYGCKFRVHVMPRPVFSAHRRVSADEILFLRGEDNHRPHHLGSTPEYRYEFMRLITTTWL